MDDTDREQDRLRADYGNVLSDWMTREELAAQIGVKVDTLRRWDAKRSGPPFAKIGLRVLYRREAVREWLRSCEIDPRGGRGR